MSLLMAQCIKFISHSVTKSRETGENKYSWFVTVNGSKLYANIQLNFNTVMYCTEYL
jgi:hypothetical protein